MLQRPSSAIAEVKFRAAPVAGAVLILGVLRLSAGYSSGSISSMQCSGEQDQPGVNVRRDGVI